MATKLYFDVVLFPTQRALQNNCISLKNPTFPQIYIRKPILDVKNNDNMVKSIHKM